MRAATAMAKAIGLEIIEVFKEIETQKRANLRRPALREACENCAKDGAVLIIADIKGLGQNVPFLDWIVDFTENYGVVVAVCDIPELDGSQSQQKFIWRTLARIAKLENRVKQETAKTAMTNAKKRGVRLGNPNIREISSIGGRAMRTHSKEFAFRIIPIIEEIEGKGILSMRGIARALTVRGVKTYAAEGGSITKRWNSQSVKSILQYRKNYHDKS